MFWGMLYVVLAISHLPLPRISQAVEYGPHIPALVDIVKPGKLT